MLPGETILSGASDKCCGKKLKFQVLQSGAGYYIGTWCPNCGPYSRESGYYRSEKGAQYDLTRDPDGKTWGRVSITQVERDIKLTNPFGD